MRDLARPDRTIVVEDGEWLDPARERRIPYRSYRPEGGTDNPVIVYSHGLGGSRQSGERWLQHWASHGFCGIALQHAGTDETVFANASPMALRRILRTTADPDQLATRAADVSHAIDRLISGELPHADPTRIGIAGHSFGAVTVQALSGERLNAFGLALCDPRPIASLAFSPSARGSQGEMAERFACISRPFFSLTGSRDGGIGPGDIDPGNRSLPFEYMPGPDKYLLVLADAGHLAFAGHGSSTEARLAHRETARRDIDAIVLAATTGFWLQHLAGSTDTGVQRALAGHLWPEDRFVHKARAVR